MIKKLLKYKININIILSIIVVCVFFIIGEIEDAPGVCLIGMIISFILIMYEFYRKKIVKQGYTIPITLLVLGIISILLVIVLIIDNEILLFSNTTFIVSSIGILMIWISVRKIKKLRFGSLCKIK